MIDYLLEKLEIPLDAWADVRITKKLFEENAELNKLDLKMFLDSVEHVRLAAQINEQTAGVSPFKDEERDYSELALIVAELRRGSYEKVCKTIHQAIPYPTLVVVYKGEEFAVSIAKKRVNKNDRTKAIVESVASTQWLVKGSKEQQILFDKTRFPAFVSDDLHLIIEVLFALIELHPAACELGLYPAIDKLDEALFLKEQIDTFAIGITETKKKMDKEKVFGRRVELNVKLKELEKHKEEYIEKLRGMG